MDSREDRNEAEREVSLAAFADIIDTQPIQALMEDFYAMSQIPMSIVGLEGKVFAGVGWQEICLKFHRVHPDTCKNCVESDTLLPAGVSSGDFRLYRCKNNMWSISSPVHVEGKHLANLFSSQFFFEDEPIDYEIFRSQAKQHGFDEKAYLSAVDAVPRLSRERVDKGMRFILRLSSMISSLCCNNLRLTHALAERDLLLDSLRRSEDRLRVAQRSAGIGTWEWDPRTGRSFWTEEIWRLFGLNPAICEPDFEAWMQTVHPDDRGRVERTVREAVHRGSEFIVEWRSQDGNGSERWLMSHGQSLPGSDQTPGHYAGFVLDITDRRPSEGALRKSEEKYRMLFENSLSGIALHEMLWDDSGKPVDYIFLDANPAIETQTGLRPADILGRRVTEVLPGIEKEPFIDLYGKVVLTGKPIYFERFSATLARHYAVSAYRVSEKRFATVSYDITERKRAEERLRQRLHYQRAVVQCTRVLAGTDRFEDRLSFVVDAIQKATGVSRAYIFRNEEVPGVGLCMSHTHEKCADGIEPQIHNAALQHLPYDEAAPSLLPTLLSRETFVGRVPEMEGLEREILESQGIQSVLIQPIWCGDSLWGFIGYDDCNAVRQWDKDDISLLSVVAEAIGTAALQVHSERSLRETERNFRTFFESMSDIIVAATPEGRILFTNRAAQRKLGYSGKEFASMNLMDFHPADRRREAEETFAKVLQEEKGTNTLPLESKNGSLIPVETRAWSGEWNGMKCLFGCSKDLTGEVEAEQRFEGLFRDNPAAMSLNTASNRKFFDVNNSFLSTTGYSRVEVIGKTPEELGLFLNPDEQKEAAERLLSEGYIEDYLLRIRRRDGSLLDGLFSGNVIQSQGQDLLLTVMIDVTERNRAEEEKERLQAQLLQVQKVESIGRLAGGVAHDLNNLLTPILGYAEILLDELDPDDTRRDHADVILQAGTRARDLIRQLLAFSRKQTLEFKPINIKESVLNFVELLRRTIREDIEIRFVTAGEIPSIMADIGQIEQVIMNLAVNAADAMPNGGNLTIEARKVYLDEVYAKSHSSIHPGDYVLLAVSDTGCGMSEEVRANIFEPFFSTKGVLGTGMGLAMVYGIVKQHGGSIWVYSEAGRGSTFKIYLPVVQKAPRGKRADAKVTTEFTGSETILLVEDNDQLRGLTFDILKRQGYRLLTAEDGPKALSVLESHDGPVQLLLTDVIMPGMNGRELYEKAFGLRPKMKVLYMSGYTADAIAHSGVLGEGVQFIEKPFTLKGLATKVREVLDQE